MLAASLLTTLRSRERKRSPIKPTHSRPLLAYAAEPSHESLEKEWAVHLKTFQHPGRPHFSDDPCVQPTSHYSGNTKINSMRASCPPLPQCSGSHTGLLAWEPALAWLTTDVLLLPLATQSQGLLSRAYCYYKIFYWAPSIVLDAEDENTHLTHLGVKRDRQWIMQTTTYSTGQAKEENPDSSVEASVRELEQQKLSQCQTLKC